MKKKLATVCFALLKYGPISAVTAYNGCPDFSDLNAGYVEPYASEVGNELVAGRHTLITKQGTDPRTEDSLKLIPEGQSWSVKLGNELVGSENESLTYHFVPNKDYPYLEVDFAVVLQNPGHDKYSQPYFSVAVTDAVGNPLTACAAYEVYSRIGEPGFAAVDNSYGQVLWRDWSKIMVDLSNFIGQEVLVSFHTRDCTYAGHYGYAYFNSACKSNDVELQKCAGNGTVTLSMPDGFKSYVWSDGTLSPTYEGTISDKGLWCDVTSVFGSVSRVFVTLPDKLNPMPDLTTESICEDEYYRWYNFDIQRGLGEYNFTCFEVDPTSCTINKKMLNLNVLKSINHIDTAICYGEDYVANGFQIYNPPVGLLCDTLDLGMTGSCRQLNILNLRVVPSSISPVIEGDDSPCMAVRKTYSVDGNYNCIWHLPDSVHLVCGSVNSPSVDVTVMRRTPAYMTVTCNNGCAEVSVKKLLEPSYATHSFYEDSVCLGTAYNKNGWDLGLQDKVGVWRHIKSLGDTCGSTEVLQLHVLNSPIGLKIKGDSVVCQGQQVTLSASDSLKKGAVDYIAVGDVICSDGSFMKWNDFLQSRKQAEAIVFKVFPDGKHGKAMSIYEYGGLANTEVNREAFGVGSYKDMYALYLLKWYLNPMLSQISGADILQGAYWTASTPIELSGINTFFIYIDFDTEYSYDISAADYLSIYKMRTIIDF